METLAYDIREVRDYINWTYFFHAWGFQPRFAAVAGVHGCVSCLSSWRNSFSIEDQPKAQEAIHLYREAVRMLSDMDGRVKALCRFALFPANSDGDDIIVGGNTVLPMLRQQTSHADDKYMLCLSDFIRPLSSGQADTIGIFAATVDDTAMTAAANGSDPYGNLLVQTLSDRLVEAAVEKMHLYVRRRAWGYAPFEDLGIADLLDGRFQGIRPAVGYPSMPDQSVNFIIDSLIGMHGIGITLTENGAMHPHASVSGLMISHPQARYFAVGRIGQDQFEDYARRRRLPPETMHRFLAANMR